MFGKPLCAEGVRIMWGCFIGDVSNAESAVWFVCGHCRPAGSAGAVYLGQCLVSGITVTPITRARGAHTPR